MNERIYKRVDKQVNNLHHETVHFIYKMRCLGYSYDMISFILYAHSIRIILQKHNIETVTEGMDVWRNMNKEEGITDMVRALASDYIDSKHQENKK